MKCFYHNDMDGRCAAFCVHLSVGLNDKYSLQADGINFIPIDYKDRFPIETIRPDEQVYLVDYSIQPDEMRQLLAITQNVTWIDHHKTAIEKYKDFEHEIRGIRHDGIAGCELAFIYIHRLTARGSGPIKPFDPEMRKDLPLFVRLIGDRDTWQWEYGEKTRLFYAGLELHDTSPESDVWHDAMETIAPFLQKGEIVERYKKIQRLDLLKSLAFWTDFEGYRCIAANVGRTSSELFESVKQAYDIMMPFCFDGNQWTVSLYSQTVDVSEIAKKYGGGGHKGAAGFVCRELPFKKKEAYRP